MRQDSPDFGVNLGEGFDFKTQSHLIQLFGFANICANWDYSPSRELTAMVYPLFEYSLLVYLCLDFLNTKLSYQRGELEEWFWSFSKIVFPINLFLCAQFRKFCNKVFIGHHKWMYLLKSFDLIHNRHDLRLHCI